jgi:hypothetical protein
MQLIESLRRNSILNLSNYLVLTYTLFLMGFFFIPNAVSQYKFFIGAVFLPGLFAIKDVLKTLKYNRLWYLILLYLIYMLITSFWSKDFSAKELSYSVRLAAYIIMFLLITVLIYQYDQTVFEKIIKFVSICAAIAAAVSIVIWYAEHPFPISRLVGIGTIENPNPSAFIYGFFAVLSCYYAFQSKSVRDRLGFTSVCAILLGFVALTQSNTGILATMLSVTLVLVFYKHNKLIILGAGITGIGLAGLYLLSSVGMLSDPTDIGFLERLPIWRRVLEQASSAAMFGNGYQKELLLTPSGDADIANYAHNTFLATARDGGLLGLSLQLLMLLAAVGGALRIASIQGDPIYIILVIFGLICMSADTDQIITRPRELWIIYWLPLAMMLARDTIHIQKTAYAQLKNAKSSE